MLKSTSYCSLLFAMMMEVEAGALYQRNQAGQCSSRRPASVHAPILSGGSKYAVDNLLLIESGVLQQIYTATDPPGPNITPGGLENKTLVRADKYECRIPYRRDGISRKHLLGLFSARRFTLYRFVLLRCALVGCLSCAGRGKIGSEHRKIFRGEFAAHSSTRTAGLRLPHGRRCAVR